MAEVNFMMAMMTAVQREQSSLSSQQNIDGQSTIACAQSEQTISDTWNGTDGILEQDAKAIASASSDAARSAAQAKFQSDSAKAQSQISTADGLTQQEQNQSGMDSSNLQNVTGLAKSVNDIGATLASALANS